MQYCCIFVPTKCLNNVFSKGPILYNNIYHDAQYYAIMFYINILRICNVKNAYDRQLVR